MSKILCVDDSTTIRSIIREALEPNGFTVIEAENGFKGLEAVKAHPDLRLIIADVNMPEMDGITMCERIKSEKLLSNVPILMLTTEISFDLKAKGKSAGVVGWMNKPFDSNKLVAAIQRLIGVAHASI